jgi:NAD(P)-dependent dehydrogenase (short-subunit alcohol dehydrogenase family)
MFDLTGRVALVTGAGQGVGSGIALTLARQGATVAVNDLFADRAEATVATIVAEGHRGVAAPFDVTGYDAVVAGCAQIAQEVGPVDILVNNAGIPTAGFPTVPFKDSDPATWARFIELNLFGVLNCTHAVVAGMCDRGWGRIVTISSEAARLGMAINVSVYGASKAGALGLMRHLAVEVAPAGVTVNSITLGGMDNIGAEWAERAAMGIPRRRLGSGIDAGAAVVYFASEEADWVTGQVLPVNGGTNS